MLNAISNWLGTIPLQDPLRAVLIIGEVFCVAFVLHSLWEVAFVVAAKLKRRS